METVSIQTTQNIAINYKLAGLGDRILAFVLDTLIIIAYVLVAMYIFRLGSTQVQMPTALEVLIGIGAYLYFLISEVTLDGQTLGKKALKIRVVKLDGSKPSFGAYLLRWIMLPIDYSMTGGVAMVSIILTKRGQRIGDLLAGTTVVKVKRVDTTLLKNKLVMKQVDDDYQPVFPEAVKLDDNDIRLIHKAIAAFRQHSQREPVEMLRQKIEEKIQVKSDLPDIKFLFTLAKDYAHYSGRGL